MSVTVRIRVGRASMTLRGPSAAELEAQVRRIMVRSIPRLERRRDAVWEAMRTRWPVRTGRSLESWTRALQVDASRQSVAAVIVSDEPAVRFIKSDRVGKQRGATRWRMPLQTEIMKPMREAQREVLAEARELLEADLTAYLSRKPT